MEAYNLGTSTLQVKDNSDLIFYFYNHDESRQTVVYDVEEAVGMIRDGGLYYGGRVDIFDDTTGTIIETMWT